jgi:hypothetical protein
MRKLLVLAGLLLALSASAQIATLKAFSTASKAKDYYGNWKEWTETTATNIEIVVNADISRIVVFSKETHYYDILENEGSRKDSDGYEYWSYWCVNQNGLNSRIRLYKAGSKERSQMYIDYNDLYLMFNYIVLK